MNWITDNMEKIVGILVAIHVVAVMIVNMTPTPKDDAVVAKVYAFIEKLAGIVTKKSKE